MWVSLSYSRLYLSAVLIDLSGTTASNLNKLDFLKRAGKASFFFWAVKPFFCLCVPLCCLTLDSDQTGAEAAARSTGVTSLCRVNTQGLTQIFTSRMNSCDFMNP